MVGGARGRRKRKTLTHAVEDAVDDGVPASAASFFAIKTIPQREEGVGGRRHGQHSVRLAQPGDCLDNVYRAFLGSHQDDVSGCVYPMYIGRGVGHRGE
jgi:hypothetical protein